MPFAIEVRSVAYSGRAWRQAVVVGRASEARQRGSPYSCCAGGRLTAPNLIRAGVSWGLRLAGFRHEGLDVRERVFRAVRLRVQQHGSNALDIDRPIPCLARSPSRMGLCRYGLRHRQPRQVNGEDASVARYITGVQPATVGFGTPSAEREPNTQATPIGAALLE
jgi:hypothetical protein